MASRTARLLLATVTGLLIARILQPEGRGTYAVIATAASMAMVLGHLSVERSQIALWADPARRRALASNSLVLGLVLGALTALAGVAMTVLGLLPTASPLMVLALLAVPFGVAAINLNGIALLRSQADVVNRGALAAAATQCLPLLVLIALGDLTVTGVVVCWTVSITVPFLLLLWALRPLSPRCELRLARRQLAIGGRYHAGRVAFHFLTTVDILLLDVLDSAAAAGIYTVAVTVLALTRIPADAIAQVALPRQACADTRDAERVTVRTLRLNLLVSSVLIGTLAAASPVLVPLVYGDSFTGSVVPLLVLAPGAVAFAMIRLVEQHLVRLERPIAMTAIAVGALAANVLLNLALIPRWGAAGASLASTVTYIPMAVLEIAWFARSAGMPMRAFLPRAGDVRLVAARLATLKARRRPGR
ncbi:O-antigen/teichoic acid export membrane protein [Streptosporangium becharense]|uniref:O-antigen/teichoic acid export membrane protein n=1 Tax=Streptosporangium becharense TaxID=1816182 RepID=A0A7W9ILW6_9ACTN|nr:polysaccharide biosynthesis C-terminal domain-containing protein [Streptosporangium becharense]MBB2911634.1 O-antigen/teichoic acid export membrane protein [Streptosporangium becharense]MBB5822548.1 O-antigen/teichoic acid export membrane protein [Streptosporangium becharense]